MKIYDIRAKALKMCNCRPPCVFAEIYIVCKNHKDRLESSLGHVLFGAMGPKSFLARDTAVRSFTSVLVF